MRDVLLKATADALDQTLLTTGEAARLLGASRQHVVDLCRRGDLPFVTVGKHRRVRRADVEALRERAERMTRDQLRSLWIWHAIAGRIVAGPETCLRQAHINIERMRSAHRGQALRWLDEWEELLRGPIELALEALTSKSPRARELRQNSPFAGVLPEEERQEILKQFKAVKHLASGRPR
jgi:excisionase family DNA binding protein